jgi:hypothetical protein
MPPLITGFIFIVFWWLCGKLLHRVPTRDRFFPPKILAYLLGFKPDGSCLSGLAMYVQLLPVWGFAFSGLFRIFGILQGNQAMAVLGAFLMWFVIVKMILLRFPCPSTR